MQINEAPSAVRSFLIRMKLIFLCVFLLLSQKLKTQLEEIKSLREKMKEVADEAL